MSAIMQPIDWQACSAEQQQAAAAESGNSASASISATVQDVLVQVKQQGDAALRAFSALRQSPCQQITRPVKSVGLYIRRPGRRCSTVLMLATPARIAGCGRVTSSPPPIADEILYAARRRRAEECFRSAARRRLPPLAFGTESGRKWTRFLAG